MQNCPLKTTQIASVMALNSQNCKKYGALPQITPGELTPHTLNSSCKRVYPADERICH